MKGIVREIESAHVVLVPERRGALKYLVVFGFEPPPPVRQASVLSIVLCPSGIMWYLVETISIFVIVPSLVLSGLIIPNQAHKIVGQASRVIWA